MHALQFNALCADLQLLQARLERVEVALDDLRALLRNGIHSRYGEPIDISECILPLSTHQFLPWLWAAKCKGAMERSTTLRFCVPYT